MTTLKTQKNQPSIVMKPLVSILIPAYNAEEFIGLSIESALDQTYQFKEIIVVDDGSSDKTFNIAKQYEELGVKVHRQENAGAATARNTAFSLSCGDYIQWLDADDMLHPEKISRQISKLQAAGDNRALASAAWGKFFYRKEKAHFNESALWSDLSPQEWLTRKMESGAHMQTATWLVSREITDAAGPWNTQLLGDDDGEYFCRVLLQSSRVCFVKEAQVFYRATGTGSLSYSIGNNKKLDALLSSIKMHIDYMLSLDDGKRTKRAIITYLQKYIFDFSPERPDLVEQLKKIAVTHGGRLNPWQAPWKYYWIQKVFGQEAAKRAKFTAPKIKSSAIRYWDKMMYRVEERARKDIVKTSNDQTRPVESANL